MCAQIPGKAIQRVFEQPPDAITCYAELVQTVVTEHEVILQFYEPVPGPPIAPVPVSGPPEGQVGPGIMRSRLRATIILNKQHALRLATSLAAASRAAAGSSTGPQVSAE